MLAPCRRKPEGVQGETHQQAGPVRVACSRVDGRPQLLATDPLQHGCDIVQGPWCASRMVQDTKLQLNHAGLTRVA